MSSISTSRVTQVFVIYWSDVQTQTPQLHAQKISNIHKLESWFGNLKLWNRIRIQAKKPLIGLLWIAWASWPRLLQEISNLYFCVCEFILFTCVYFAVFSEPTLQFLITGLQQKPLASAAATALQSICSQCQDQMVANFSGLLQVAHAVDSFNLSNEAVIGVLKGTFPFGYWL